MDFVHTFSANVVCLGQGCGVGWLSPSLPVLLSPNSPLSSGPVSNDEAGWIGAVLSLGAIFGTFTFGLLANFIGTKVSLLLCVIPTAVILLIENEKARNKESYFYGF